jgi:hypothetical protein
MCPTPSLLSLVPTKKTNKQKSIEQTKSYHVFPQNDIDCKMMIVKGKEFHH